MPITLNGSTGIILSTWTTAGRPSAPTQDQMGFNTTTLALDVYNGTSWTSIPMPTSQGTSGQYLQSAGAGAAPTWATLSASGGLVRAPQILTSGTSYTTPAGCNSILVQAWGAGGGGGGASPSNVSGGGGGGGAYMQKYISVTPSTAYTIAIGALGAGGSSGSTGSAGGTTSITVSGTTYSAGGGNGGGGAGGGVGGGGGSGGTATNGDLNLTGYDGSSGTTGASALGGAGATVKTYWINVPGAASALNAAGRAAVGYGAGGGGASAISTPFSGGNGTAGIMFITEYT